MSGHVCDFRPIVHRGPARMDADGRYLPGFEYVVGYGCECGEWSLWPGGKRPDVFGPVMNLRAALAVYRSAGWSAWR